MTAGSPGDGTALGIVVASVFMFDVTETVEPAEAWLGGRVPGRIGVDAGIEWWP